MSFKVKLQKASDTFDSAKALLKPCVSCSCLKDQAGHQRVEGADQVRGHPSQSSQQLRRRRSETKGSVEHGGKHQESQGSQRGFQEGQTSSDSHQPALTCKYLRVSMLCIELKGCPNILALCAGYFRVSFKSLATSAPNNITGSIKRPTENP